MQISYSLKVIRTCQTPPNHVRLVELYHGKAPRKVMPVVKEKVVSQIIVEKGICTRLQLLAYSNNQKREGKTYLAEFIANRGAKAVDEALSVGWELEEAEGKKERSKKSRAEILYSQLGKECFVGCDRRWLQMARDVLGRNNIAGDEFSEGIRNLLDKGRGKYRTLKFKRPI